MSGRAAFLALAVGFCCAACASAEIIVNAAQPITRRVTVQLVQTALDDGASPATVFGNATQRAGIEAAIDEIWAQAGIDVAFLPTVNRYNDTFAYQGNDGTGTRNSGDFNTIFNNARNEGGILNSNSSVLNLILANVVPAFRPLSENSSAGYARVRGNGIIGFVGDNLLGWEGGRDVIASVMAHEIGHNLGLNHTGDNLPNLMSPGGDTEQLDASQITTARSSSFALAIAAQLAGDYNGDGTVDAADYSVWRNAVGNQGAGLPADGDGNGRIDSGDYTVWKTNYGDSSGAGGPGDAITVVPEANGLLYISIALSLVRAARRVRYF